MTASLATKAATPIAEAQLITDAQAGDTQAFKALYELHHKQIYALCLRLCGDSAVAEEALQDAFVRAWQKLPLFAGNSQFSTWLHKLSVNQALTTLKKHRSFWHRFLPIDEHIEPQVEQAHYENLDKLLLKLPERTRIVFVLFALEGYTHQEIAELLDIATGTSKAQYHRAKTLLQEQIL
ncbi:RNA polymerase sigma factor [Shewanella waksmanii]|uniref:RNA polymerase sigma factor n=1 Tax=Shewanella waksmanii TaxID=213783 RepID=UPI003736F7E3